jgi:tetratricopeptide (TPR) repeat protein
MRQFFNFAALMLACCLLPLCAARAGEPASLQEGLATARQRMEEGKFPEAFRAYIDLLWEYPEEFEVNLGLARAARQAGRLNHSLMAYERVLAFAPQNAVLRLEYAWLLLSLGRAEQAAEQLAEARRLDPAITEGELGKAVSILDRRTATLTGSGRLAGGFIYDSNMTLAPSRSAVQVGGFNIILDSRSRAKESWGSYLHASGEGAWRSSPDASWWLVGDVAWYQRWYNETNPRRDMAFGRAAAGLRYLEDDFLAEIRLKTESLLENEEHAVSLYGVEATLIRALTPEFHLVGRGGTDHRDDQDVAGRSGTYVWAGTYGRWFFNSEKGHSALFGVKGYAAATDVSRYGFAGIEPSVNLNVHLPWRTELIFALAWRYEDYNGPATVLDNPDRRDTQWRASVFALKKLADNVQVEAGWQYTENRSNSDLYKYDQHMFLLGLALVF